GTTSKHRGAVESKNTHAFKGKRWPIKQVDREVIGVLGRGPAAVPKRELWVIADPRRVGRIMLDRVKKPAAADRVARLGNGNTLIEWSCPGKRSRKSKIAHHPAISLMIIKDEPIAIVEARTRRAYQGQEERVVGRSIGAIERIPVFIKNLDRTVHRLDIVIRADIAIGVRWQTHATTLA